MKRLATAAWTVPVALAVLFFAPPRGFFAFVLVLAGVAAWELVDLARRWAPRRTFVPLVVLVPVVAWLLVFQASQGAERVGMIFLPLLAVVAGLWVVIVRTPIAQAPFALGLLVFAVPYFAAPVAALVALQRVDPWWVFALFAVVWLGDTAAYYAGSRLGRHKMAPQISPNKSWEGAVAALLMAVAATIAFGIWRLGEVSPALLALAAVTSVCAQLGDLVESCFKRAAGVKDSGRLLPGHGGMLDRLDALLFAAPVWWLGLMLLEEIPRFAPTP